MKDRKVLFLAMSGVRVQDPDLLAIGLTLPGFVDRSRVIASLPSLSLLALAGCTPTHWEIVYRECDGIADGGEGLVDGIAAERFDLVAMSSFTARILDTYAIADRLRAAGVRVVLGGLHVSACPDEAAAHADAIVVGEGEDLWPELLADLEAGRLRSRYSTLDSPGRPFDFARAPKPRYDLLDLERYNRLTLQTSRGCPRACHFCGASRTISRYKTKPIALVERDLEAILELWPHPFLELADDNSFVDRYYARELIALLARHPVRWFTETEISIADDPQLLEALAAAHCAQILIGLESASAAALAEVDGSGWKHAQFSKMRERIRFIQSFGISVNGCFVLGFDGDGPSIFEETADFIESCDLAEVQITLLTPFPGTALERRLRAEGRLLSDTPWDHCTLFDTTFVPARMSVEELRTGFRGLMQRVYAVDAVERRRSRFRNCVREGLRRRQSRDPRPRRRHADEALLGARHEESTEILKTPR